MVIGDKLMVNHLFSDTSFQPSHVTAGHGRNLPKIEQSYSQVPDLGLDRVMTYQVQGERNLPLDARIMRTRWKLAMFQDVSGCFRGELI